MCRGLSKSSLHASQAPARALHESPKIHAECATRFTRVCTTLPQPQPRTAEKDLVLGPAAKVFKEKPGVIAAAGDDGALAWVCEVVLDAPLHANNAT